MVVLCLRFRTGTQILIYFPVLLQISSVTSGQLLWEKHVKAPKWLMNPSACTKRSMAADSQREKLAIAKAIPRVMQCSTTTLASSECQEASATRGGWLPSEWSWKVSRGWHGREGSAALWPPVGTSSLGNRSLSWFPASAQFSMVAHIWERLRCDAWICAGRRCQDWHGWLVYPEGNRDSWLFASCLGQKKKEPGANICLKGNWFQCGELLTWFTAHPYPSDSALEPTSQKPKRSDKVEEQCALSCSQSVKQNCSQDTVLPFSPFDPSLSGLGAGCLFACQCRI